MTDEVKLPSEGTTPQPEDKAPEAPQLTELEQRALSMGWRPKEDFAGNEDDFIDAKEFVRRKPLFDKIEGQSKELKNVKKALDALKTHYTKVQETEYNRALAKLQEAREEAITNSDGRAAVALEKEIKNVENQMAEIQKVQSVQDTPEPEINPAFTAWQHKNQWYQDTPYMRVWADDYGVKLAKTGMDPMKVLQEVEKAVRKEFPNKFTNPNKASAPDVEGSSSGSSKRGGSGDSFELSDQERNIMNTLVRQGVLTKEKYIADLKAAKGIK